MEAFSSDRTRYWDRSQEEPRDWGRRRHHLCPLLPLHTHPHILSAWGGGASRDLGSGTWTNPLTSPGLTYTMGAPHPPFLSGEPQGEGQPFKQVRTEASGMTLARGRDSHPTSYFHPIPAPPASSFLRPPSRYRAWETEALVGRVGSQPWGPRGRMAPKQIHFLFLGACLSFFPSCWRKIPLPTHVLAMIVMTCVWTFPQLTGSKLLQHRGPSFFHFFITANQSASAETFTC